MRVIIILPQARELWVCVACISYAYHMLTYNLGRRNATHSTQKLLSFNLLVNTIVFYVHIAFSRLVGDAWMSHISTSQATRDLNRHIPVTVSQADI